MYLIKNCSLAVSVLICCIAGSLLGILPEPLSIIFVLLQTTMLAADILMFKLWQKKTHIAALTSVVSIFAHFFTARVNITVNCAATGLFLLLIGLLIAFSYRKEELGNSPIFGDPYLGKRAYEIAFWFQLSLSVVTLHSIIYVGNVLYTVISFAAGSLLTVVAAQIILSPLHKELENRDRAEREMQIKKEQGYR